MKNIKIIIMILLIISLIGCNKEEPIEEKSVKLTSVEVIKPEVDSLSNSTVIAGKLKSKEEVVLMPKISGVENVEEVRFSIGDNVKEGDIIVILDNEATTDQIESSRLAYLTAKKNYDTLLESNKVAKANLSRTLELYKTGAASEQQLDSAKLQASEGQLKTVKSQLDQSLFSYNNIKKILENTVLITPIDGVISLMDFQKNNLASSQSKIVITNMDILEVELQVTENIINKIKKDDAVKVEMLSENIKINSTIEYVNPVSDVRTGLYTVVININNDKNILKPGMFVRVHLTINSNEEIMLLPIDSVLTDENGSFVYVADGNNAKVKYIYTGVDNGEVIEIIEGLSIDDLVIFKGQNFIVEGSEIRVVGGK